MKIKANGILINYEITGSGDFILLIHGSGDNLKAWYNQIPAFSKEYRVLTFDLRGHGQTELGGDYNFDTWADDVYGLLKALDIDKAYILGYSMGGSIAATFTIKHPEMVKALVLSNSGGFPATEENIRLLAQRRQVQIEAMDKEGMPGVFELRKKGTFSPGFTEKHHEVMEKYRDVLMGNRVEGYKAVLQSTVSHGPIEFFRITCPVLVIVGEHDAFSGPESGRTLQGMIAGSELKIFPTGHASGMEVPEDYNRTVLDFLARARK